VPAADRPGVPQQRTPSGTHRRSRAPRGMMRSMSVWCSLIATGARSRKGYLYGSYIGARGGRYGNQGAVRQFLGAEEPIGAANALGASIPATVSASVRPSALSCGGNCRAFGDGVSAPPQSRLASTERRFRPTIYPRQR
jgi:hypothetical protein